MRLSEPEKAIGCPASRDEMHVISPIHPGLLLAAWGITALMTVMGALSYGELAAAMPKNS